MVCTEDMHINKCMQLLHFHSFSPFSFPLLLPTAAAAAVAHTGFLDFYSLLIVYFGFNASFGVLNPAGPSNGSIIMLLLWLWRRLSKLDDCAQDFHS